MATGPTETPGRRAPDRQRRPAGNGPRAAGFTLVEILVVLAIVAVMVVAVGLSVGAGGGSRRVVEEAERLRALLELGCDDSARFGRENGVRFAQAGYLFLQADGRDWRPHADPGLRTRRLPEGMRLELALDGRAVELGPPAEADAPSPTGEVRGDAAVGEGDADADLAPHLACDTDGGFGGTGEVTLFAGPHSARVSIDAQDGAQVDAGAARP